MSRSPRALVAEDQAGVRVALTTLLEASGFEVVSAPDGEVAVAQFEQGAYSLVLLDVEMPRLDGLAALEVIRSADPRVPVIVMSGRAGYGQPALRAGALAFITKPFDVDELHELLRSAAPRGVSRPDAAEVGCASE